MKKGEISYSGSNELLCEVPFQRFASRMLL